MPKVYLSPYNSTLTSNHIEGSCSNSCVRLHAALRRREWPYDYGDDPSFFCRLNLNGALTWGVCRADVRGQLKPGDVVVFFAFTNVGERVEYRLSGLATVEQKIRQSDIFFRSAYEKYRLYLNLLVHPTDGNGRNWTHHEPAAPHVWHKDWLSRIAPFRRFGKTELNRCSAKRQISLDLSIDGRPFIFGENYILFSIDPTKKFILDHPSIIAYSEPPHAEVWCNDRLSRAVSKQTIENGPATWHHTFASLGHRQFGFDPCRPSALRDQRRL